MSMDPSGRFAFFFSVNPDSFKFTSPPKVSLLDRTSNHRASNTEARSLHLCWCFVCGGFFVGWVGCFLVVGVFGGVLSPPPLTSSVGTFSPRGGQLLEAF